MHEYYQGLCGLVTSEPAGLTLHLLNSHTEITVKYSQHPQHFIFQHPGGAPAAVVPLCDACVGLSNSPILVRPASFVRRSRGTAELPALSLPVGSALPHSVTQRARL